MSLLKGFRKERSALDLSDVQQRTEQEDELLKVREDSSPFDSEAEVARVGREDGENRIPAMDAYAPSQFEQGIISRGETKVHLISEAAQNARSRINRDLQPVISQLRNINSRWKSMNERMEARKAALGRDHNVFVPPGAHWGIVSFLALSEFPLNAIVFRMFNEPEIMTYFISSSLAIMIPLVAVFVGTSLRHGFSNKVGKAILGLILVASVLGVLGAVTYVRSMYLQMHGNLATGGESNALVYSIFAINMFVFIAAMAVSFNAHDADEALDGLYKDIKALEKNRKPYVERYSKLASRLNAVLRVAESKIHTERSRTLSLVYLYRQSNAKARSPNPEPMAFNRDPKIPTISLWESITEFPDEV